jgi:hypothetical protein
MTDNIKQRQRDHAYRSLQNVDASIIVIINEDTTGYSSTKTELVQYGHRDTNLYTLW